jgi:hypothetical protein
MTEVEQPETVGGMMGRIATGVALMLLGGAFAIGCVAGFVLGMLNPDTADGVDFAGEFIGYAALIGLAIAVAGFELVRRGRRARTALVASVIDTTADFTATPVDGSRDYVAPPPLRPLV